MQNYLNLSLYILTSISIILFAVIIIYHQIQNRKKRIINDYKKKYYPIFEAYINNNISHKEAKSKIKQDLNFEVMVEVLKPLLKKYSGEKYEKLKYLIQQMGINEHYLKNLNSNNRKKKLKAAAILGKLADERALNTLVNMLDSSDELMIITASWALSDIGKTDSLNMIINVLFNKTEMTYEAITELLVNFDQKICDKLLYYIENQLKDENYFTTHFDVAEFKLLALYIDIFGFFRYEKGLNAMKKLLNQDLHEEVIIHILKTLVKIGKPLKIDFKKYLSHENWVIRSQTAKYISEIKNPNYLEELKSLLSDDNWWVRYYAAKAIWELGKINLLIDIIIKNKPGANICDYILAQNNYNYVLGDNNDI